MKVNTVKLNTIKLNTIELSTVKPRVMKFSSFNNLRTIIEHKDAETIIRDGQGCMHECNNSD